MDELEISGKRYISAKRIAKENRYHPDYVGQLIRAGRISGTKVGRAWYVDEVSFAEYLGKERGAFGSPIQKPEVVTESAQNLPPEPELVTEPAQNFSSGSVEPGESFAPASAPVEIVQKEIIPETFAIVEPAYIPPPAEKKVAFKTSLTYIPDNSPLFPAIQKRTKAVEVKKDEYTVAQIATPTYTAQPISRPKRSGWKTGFAAVSLVAVAGIFFSVAFFGSLGINSTVIVEKGKPASVAFAQEKTFCFIFGSCQNSKN
ncbi:hypothetical protein A2590_00080 [Candidatus Adlerbacteria bacterium RIFOXYD1_FULL_48_8]|nr:MAG: hypothetical protein A2590_00080 [Candidatus Adlerbacteria bacterium RIFOXYD1_FULL_48_8]